MTDDDDNTNARHLSPTTSIVALPSELDVDVDSPRGCAAYNPPSSPGLTLAVIVVLPTRRG
jgi:hypothetical protein